MELEQDEGAIVWRQSVTVNFFLLFVFGCLCLGVWIKNTHEARGFGMSFGNTVRGSAVSELEIRMGTVIASVSVGMCFCLSISVIFVCFLVF
jgi:hypothetical protein